MQWHKKVVHFWKTSVVRYMILAGAVLFVSTSNVVGGIYPVQLRQAVETVLKQANRYTPELTELLLGTAAVESDGGRYIRGLAGPELGIFQMAPQTIVFTWQKVLDDQELGRMFDRANYSRKMTARALEEKMMWDLQFQILMAVAYYKIASNNRETPKTVYGQAKFWKDYWNTFLGAGTVDKYVEKYTRMRNKEHGTTSNFKENKKEGV